MLLSELTRSQQRELMGRDWIIPGKLIQWLENNGLKEISGGFFSRVFMRPGSDRIVKIVGSRNPSPIDCSIDFAQFQRRTNNKHFPKVYALKVMPGAGYKGTNDLAIITMEFITNPFQASKIQWKNDKEYNIGLVTFLLAHDIIDARAITKAEEYLPRDFKERLTTSYGEELAMDWIFAYRSQDSLANAISIIYELVDKYDCKFADFKEDNTRMREDGTIVFLDALPF